MKEKIITIESQSIRVGIAANLVMALSGWGVYYLSGSQALLLDGNMSFILFLSSIVALKIATIKAVRSETFPFGLFVTEALYSLVKGLLLLGVIISAFTSNGGKILQYLAGEPIAMIKTGPILYYAVAMVAICWGLSAFYYIQNKKLQGNSSMLAVDQKASLIDGILSASTGAVLVVIGYIQQGSSWDFLLYIGDALLVVVLAISMLGQPVRIIKQAFVELAGGKLQNDQQHQTIAERVKQTLTDNGLKAESLNISKTGSSYLVIVGLSLEALSIEQSGQVMSVKATLQGLLADDLTFVDVEMVLV
ncbi:cation transporter [Photobacterium rosenbergii]|uniref:cation transporter n=1 Tax=Photobacterium rosenbergii TaxID=294936 RepID=UPI001C994D99|nr:cation transporter [Photobacterium rosenbergii]MBY5946847.1 cation transporter [Photobacterium rosenbergii]